MKANTTSLLDLYRRRARHDARAGLELLSRSPWTGDDEAAHLIEVLSRTTTDVNFELDDFLRAVPRLRERPVVLDAAIDAVLRRRAKAGQERGTVARELAERYPELREEIEAANILAEIVGTDSQPVAAHSHRHLPEDIGPTVPSGPRRYGLRERIASGQQGTVYLAVDRLLSASDMPSFVAVKMLAAAAASLAAMRSSAMEAIKTRRVSHPHVAQVIDRGSTDDGVEYVVFEYIDGGSLESWAKASMQRLAQREAVQLMVRIARGTQSIHSAGLLHCDLKPGNILLTRNFEPKITDFGISQWLAERQGKVEDRRLGGTVGFGAPEQFQVGGALTAETDTYALGGILLWLLTGKIPNGQTLEEAHRNLDGDAPGAVNARACGEITDPSLRAICTKALDRDHANRYQSAEAIAGDLERWLRREPLLWLREKPITKLRRWSHRERTAVIVGLVGLFVAIGAGALVTSFAMRSAYLAKQAHTAKIKEEMATEKAADMKGSIRTAMQVMNESQRGRTLESMLKQFLAAETILSTAELAGRDILGDTGANRLEVIAQLIEETRNGDEKPSITSMLYQMVYALWLANDEHYAESARQFSDNLNNWRNMLVREDRLLDLIRKLHAAALVLDHHTATTPSPRSVEVQKQLEEAKQLLSEPDTGLLEAGSRGVQNLLKKARSALSIKISALPDPEAP